MSYTIIKELHLSEKKERTALELCVWLSVEDGTLFRALREVPIDANDALSICHAKQQSDDERAVVNQVCCPQKK